VLFEVPTGLSSVPLKVSLHECQRRQVIKTCLSPPTMVRQMHAANDFLPDLLAHRVTPALDQPVLESPQKLPIGAS
jgi:hypothetical protein